MLVAIFPEVPPIAHNGPMPAITSKTEELTGEFSHEILYRPVNVADDSSERWIMAELRDGKIITGNAKKTQLQSGLSYRFLGKWGFYRERKQFEFSSFCVVEPTSLDAIERYIRKAPGIGPAIAKRIVGKYGERSIEVIRDDEVRLSSGIERFAPSNFDWQKTAGFFNRNKALESITLEVEELLHGRGFPRTLSQKVIEQWGERVCEIIRENPYVLRIFDGVGFLKCDALYEHLGLPMDAMVRQVHCVLHALESDITGSTWIPKKQVIDELRKKISGANVRAEEAIKEAIESDLIRERGSDLRSENDAPHKGRYPSRESHYSVAAMADAESSFVGDVVAAVNESVGEDGF